MKSSLQKIKSVVFYLIVYKVLIVATKTKLFRPKSNRFPQIGCPIVI